MNWPWQVKLGERAAWGALLTIGLVSCSNSAESSTARNASGGSTGVLTAQGGNGLGGSGSGVAGAQGSAGSNPGGSGGTAANTGGSADSGGSLSTAGSVDAAGGASVAGNGGAAGSSSGPFTCNLVIGNSTTQQWFEAGFLSYAGIDASHWEMYWVAHHYLDAWADASDAGWSTALDMGHACASGATAPDRVIFIATYAPPYPTQATYQTDLTSVVHNIQAKYPSVSRVELMTLIRAPGNSATACSSATSNEQSIPAAEDQAIAAVASDPTFAGLVAAAPPAYVSSCSDFLADMPQYTTAGASNIAAVYGAYYAAHR